jgi:hypothetical protein
VHAAVVVGGGGSDKGHGHVYVAAGGGVGHLLAVRHLFLGRSLEIGVFDGTLVAAGFALLVAAEGEHAEDQEADYGAGGDDADARGVGEVVPPLSDGALTGGSWGDKSLRNGGVTPRIRINMVFSIGRRNTHFAILML